MEYPSVTLGGSSFISPLDSDVFLFGINFGIYASYFTSEDTYSGKKLNIPMCNVFETYGGTGSYPTMYVFTIIPVEVKHIDVPLYQCRFSQCYYSNISKSYEYCRMTYTNANTIKTFYIRQDAIKGNTTSSFTKLNKILFHLETLEQRDYESELVVTKCLHMSKEFKPYTIMPYTPYEETYQKPVKKERVKYLDEELTDAYYAPNTGYKEWFKNYEIPNTKLKPWLT